MKCDVLECQNKGTCAISDPNPNTREHNVFLFCKEEHIALMQLLHDMFTDLENTVIIPQLLTPGSDLINTIQSKTKQECKMLVTQIEQVLMYRSRFEEYLHEPRGYGSALWCRHLRYMLILLQKQRSSKL